MYGNDVLKTEIARQYFHISPMRSRSRDVTVMGPGTDVSTPMMKEILFALLLVEVGLGVETCEVPIRQPGIRVNVTKDSESATVTVQLERPGACPTLRYSVTLECENGNETSYQPTNEHPLRFIYQNLSLNARFTLKVFANGDVTPLPVYTTDVQSVTVVPGQTDARVTCNFAVGSSCQACRLKWRDINSGVSSAGKTAMRKERDSRAATTTISPLTPGHIYSITAADLKGGTVSSVEVRGENFTTTAQDAGVSNRVVVVSSSAAAVFLCTCILLMVFLIKWNSSRDKVSVKGISKQKRRGQDRNRNKKKWKTKKLQDGDLEDALPPPPIPPYTTDMFIPATVSSTSTASTESTTVDDVIVTDSVFGDDSVTGTPNMAHCHTITFTATIESTNSDLAPPIPPRTNKMYILEQQISACDKTVPLSDSLRRGCIDKEEHIAEKGSDTESMLAQNEDPKTEVDRDVDCCEYPDDTISETSCDIGFPPPIPRRTQDMYCVQSFDSNDCTAVHIEMMPNPSYTGVHKATV